MRPLRVVHIGKFYPPHRGGMESHIAALCGELRGRVDLQVLVAGEGLSTARESVDGVPVQRLATWFTAAATPFCLGLPAAIRHARPDLLHVHLPNPGAVLACFAAGYRGPMVATYHSDVVRQRLLNTLYTPAVHKLLARCDGIIVGSSAYMASSPVLRRHTERCRIIPLGIRCEEFDRPDPNPIADQMSRARGRIVLGVGRLVYYKGFEFLIRAMKSVDARLVLVGEGPLRAELEGLAARLGVRHKVEFVGNLPFVRLVALYHAAAVFVLPSVARSEAFGIVQLEAMASGTPVINTSLDSGVPFVSRHGETGLTVPPADPTALAAAINCVLDNETLRSAFGAAARRRAFREFHVDRMVDRTLELYQDVTGRSIAGAHRTAEFDEPCVPGLPIPVLPGRDLCIRCSS